MAGYSKKSGTSPDVVPGKGSHPPGGSLASVLTLILLLAILALDQISSFTLLSPWLLGVSLALEFLLLLDFRNSAFTNRPFRRLFFWGTTLALALSGLALLHQARVHQILTSWEPGSSQRLGARAEKIQKEFGTLLNTLTAPAKELQESLPQDRGRLFSLLEKSAEIPRPGAERFGWTLWQNGQPWAWAGRTALTEGSLPGGGPGASSLIVAAQGASLILVSSFPLGEGSILVGEFLLQSPLEPVPWLPLASLRPGADRDSVRASLSGPLQDEETPDLTGRRAGRPRHGSRGNPAILYLPLQDAAGHTLLVVTLRDVSSEAMLQKLRDKDHLLGIALSSVAFLALSLACFRRALSEQSRIRAAAAWSAGGSVLLGGSRLTLLSLGGGSYRSDLLGSSRFGCSLAGPFLRSPGDLFLTALCFGILAWWIAKFLPRVAVSPRLRRPLWVATPLFLGTLGFFLYRLASEFPSDARFEISRVQIFPLDWPRLLVQSGVCILFASWLLLARVAAQTLLSVPASAGLAVGRQVPRVARGFGFASAVMLLCFPLLLRASNHQREVFFLKTLLPEVENQQPLREQTLQQVLEEIRGSMQVRKILEAAGSLNAEGTAYRLWATTRLKREGLRSSLRLLTPEGHLLGRFGLTLPSELSATGLLSNTSEPRKHFMVKIGGFKRRVLAGETAVRLSPAATYRIQIYLLDESENLSFVRSRSENPYAELFHPAVPRFTNPELVSSEPLLASYDASGRFLDCNLEGGPVLPPDALTSLPEGEVRWFGVSLGDERYRALAKRTAEGFVVLGFLLPSGLQLAGSSVRFAVLVFLVVGFLAAILALICGTARPLLHPAGGLSRRLLIIFLAASLIPLFSLAFFLHRFAAREFEANLLSEGLASLGAASRIVEDYLTTAEEGEAELPIDDGIIYWVSRIVDQDLNLYRGERLSATSTREIFASGILSSRLDASVFRSLFLRGQPFVLTRQRLASLDALTLSAPLSPGKPGSGIFSLPLTVKELEIRHKRADVDEAILIVMVAMLLLLILISDHVARRVSGPITALTAAAKRIEAGDYDAEVRLPARDEPALLIDSFNRMAASLRRQREDLRRRSDYIEKILLNATTGVISTDAEDRVVTLNPAARLLLRLSSAPASGENLPRILGSSPSLGPLASALAGSSPYREARWQLDLPWEERAVTLRVASLPFRETPDAPPGRILLLEDLTETVRSSRLEAWAEMARRIAHEVKNPLTPIQLSADHLRKVYRASDPRFSEILEQCLDTIQKQVRSLRGIAADFSDYARIPVLKPERISTREMLEEVLAPYRGNPPDGILFEVTVDPRTPDLLVDPVLTRRALINLVQNALESMREGGSVTVRADPCPGRGDGHRSFVRVRVRDTGTGMDATTRARLFEPYFSTKAYGTGLGLSIVRKTTEEQGGRVEVVSTLGSGTEVILDLPAFNA